MGSIVMDPDDIATFVNGGAGWSFNNSATICTFAHRIRSAGVFMGENPLEFSVPLLLLQLGIGAGTIILFFRLLKPLGQPLIVSQILLLDTESFAIMCICMMVMVAIITPIIRYLFEPSRRYVVSKKRTVMHSRSESDLHVLVCIHDQEDVPSAINLLEALNPTRHSHLAVYMLHLVELLGRANPQLIHHKPKKVRTSRLFEQIINAFKYFEQRNRENVRIHPFTAVSPSATMHDDVYSLALDKRTSLVLVPFHKRFHSNGVMSLSKSKIKIVNHHILDKAPCSVAVVVERGIFNVSRSIVTNSYSFQIAVVFIGGADDREAVFIGARMAGHLKINLTLI